MPLIVAQTALIHVTGVRVVATKKPWSVGVNTSLSMILHTRRGVSTGCGYVDAHQAPHFPNTLGRNVCVVPRVLGHTAKEPLVHVVSVPMVTHVPAMLHRNLASLARTVTTSEQVVKFVHRVTMVRVT